MSKARKHVQNKCLQEVPVPKDSEVIMRVVGPRGNNIIEVEDEQGSRTLCMLPAKFHKMLWLKRGNFVIVEEGEKGKAEEAGSKVTGTITAALFSDHIHVLKTMPCWPAGFRDAALKDSGAQAMAVASTLEATSIRDNQNANGNSERSNGHHSQVKGRVSSQETIGASRDDRGEGEAVEGEEGDEGEEDDDDLPPLEENTNRRKVLTYSDSSDSEESEEDDDVDRRRWTKKK